MGSVKNLFPAPQTYLRQGRARKLPILECWISEDYELSKQPTVIVVRQHVNGKVTFGSFLIDMLCRGVIHCLAEVNVDYEVVENFKIFFEKVGQKFKKVDYVFAHNMIYGAYEFALDIGLKPDKDFEWVKYVLEEDDENVELLDIEFGKDGMPLVIASTEEPMEDVIKILNNTLGPENFNVEYDDDWDDLELEDEEGDLENHGYEDRELQNQPIELPTSGNELIDSLFHTGLDIEEDKIQALLSLPREELERALENMIAFAPRHYYSDAQNDEDETSFALHAIFLLNEINCESALPEILDLLGEDESILDDYLGDYTTECLWQVVMHLGKNQIHEIFDFLSDNTESESSGLCAAIDSLSQMALYYPEKRQEVLEGVKSLIAELKENPDNFSTHFVTQLEALILDAGLVELKDELIYFHEHNLVDEFYNGKIKEVLKMLGSGKKREVLSLKELYNYFNR
jgi:hypothetical protein